jgi:ACT domain-containing protein
MLQKKSVLARLLANENISVQQGNFPTASFDVVNRVLNLPLWKDMSNDLYDMLVGHEVSHALHTPSDPEVLNIPNVPFSFVNVVEDIRIEKMIMKKYPGLVGNFTRGYNELLEMDIFGTKGKDLNALPFMDRLNIKSKGRAAIDVEFSDEERYYFDKAMGVETFEDVREVVLEIAEWLRANNEIEEANSNEVGDEENDNDSMQSEQSNESSDSNESDDSEEGNSNSETEESGEDEGESDTEEGSASDQSGEAGDLSDEKSDEDSEDEESKSAPKGAGGDIHSIIKESNDGADDLDEVATDIAQHENEGQLLDDEMKIFAQGLSRAEYEAYTIPYKRVLEVREEQMETVLENYPSTFARTKEKYVEFQADVKPIVNLMAKEFEMRKAAYRTKRAKTSTKGSLDVTKLHAYKYDDNLFKQVTTLADGKNHGLMMLVDYSGSMNNVMPAVIRQTATLVMFCKRVGIPFQVFGFTSPHGGEDRTVKSESTLTRFDSSELQLIELYSSKMSKKELDFALASSIYAAVEPWYFQSRVERLGNTPLNSALMAMQYAIEDFRKYNPVHKMSLITLTDGDSNSVRITHGSDIGRDDFYGWNTPVIVEVNGKKLDLVRSSYQGIDNTAKIIKAVAGNDITVMNFFIADRHGLRQELYRKYPFMEAEQRAARKEIKDNGALILDDDIGYDRRFIILNSGSSLSAKTEDLEVSENATPAQLAKAFKKFSGSKKNNRIITKKFAEMVA